MMKNKTMTLLADNEKRDFLISLSSDDFKGLGVDLIAYVRSFEDTLLGETRYHIYGADGKKLATVDDLDSAMATVRINDMETVTLQ